MNDVLLNFSEFETAVAVTHEPWVGNKKIQSNRKQYEYESRFQCYWYHQSQNES